MKFVISGRGSRGDIYPLIAIGSLLQERGHRVSLAIPALFEQEARDQGLEPFLYAENSREVMKSLGSGMQGSRSSLAFLTSTLNEQFDHLMQVSDDADALITHVSEMSAPTVAEYRGIPHYRLAYAPVLPGNHPPPLMPLQNMPVLFNRAAWKTLQMISRYLLRRLLNDKRETLGIPRITSSVKYYTAHSIALLAFNKVLAPPCPAWEKKGFRYHYTGYCYNHYDGPLDPALETFIRGGEPPVYAGFGSVHLKHPEKFTAILTEAARRTGTRIVMAKGWTGLEHTEPSDNIFLTGDTFHGTLFSRMAGVIHHGGSGTTHTAARAGVPQFILPQIVDQYYWGNRIRQLGLGPRPVTPKKITVKKIMQVLEAFREDTFKEKALLQAESMKGEDGVKEVIRIVEKLWLVRG